MGRRSVTKCHMREGMGQPKRHETFKKIEAVFHQILRGGGGGAKIS